MQKTPHYQGKQEKWNERRLFTQYHVRDWKGKEFALKHRRVPATPPRQISVTGGSISFGVIRCGSADTREMGSGVCFCSTAECLVIRIAHLVMG